jgi:hypothetical protein
MHITKILETTIDLIDPSEIYQHDIDRLITRKLNERYQNRCYQSILVLDVKKIIKRSSIKMVNNRLDGGAYVDVQFEVNGIILIEGEILHGCKIIEIHANAMTAEHTYAGIKLQKEVGGQISNILKVGQVIPIVVHNVRYIPYKPTISMIATPYIPTIPDRQIYYNITSGLLPEQTEKLGFLIDQIEIEEKLHESIKKQKQYDFFKDLLYPYKVNQKYEQHKHTVDLNLTPLSLDLKSMCKISSGIVIYPIEDNKYNKRFFWSDIEVDRTSSDFIVNAELFLIMASFSNQYLLYLQALRGFVTTYNTPESMKPLMLYWRLCKNAKI